MIDTGGSAFPSHGSMGEVVQEGMSLRDYFAAKAMQGLIASTKKALSPAYVSEVSYDYADDMLKERNK